MNIDWNYVIIFFLHSHDQTLSLIHQHFIYIFFFIALLVKQSKSTKHWGTFVSHCISINHQMAILIPVPCHQPSQQVHVWMVYGQSVYHQSLYSVWPWLYNGQCTALHLTTHQDLAENPRFSGLFSSHKQNRHMQLPLLPEITGILSPAGPSSQVISPNLPLPQQFPHQYPAAHYDIHTYHHQSQ
jgi:hypothetical protein